jgi:hypothetical protein
MTWQTIPASGKVGVIKDQSPQEIDPSGWTDAQNMRFIDGWAERVHGYSTIFNAPVLTPYFVTPYTTSTARFWVYAGTTNVAVDDGTTRTDITPASPFSGTQDNRWTGGSLNGVLVLNNGVQQPQYWAGNVANKLANLTAWNAAWTCSAMRPFKNFLVALNVTKSGTNYPNMVKWSSAADPGTLPVTWDTADPTHEAGELDLAETPDVMVDCLPMGDMNVIYKERSMYSMMLSGDTNIFRFQRLPGDVGMLARGCAVQVPMGHVVLAAGDVILHNGQGPQSLLQGRMRTWLQNNMDSTYYSRSFVTTNPKRNEVLICFPVAGSSLPSLALVWNWKDDTIGFRDITNVTYGATGQVNYTASNTWTGDSDTWNNDSSAWNANEYSPAEARLIMTRSTPDLVIVDTGSLFGASAPSAYIERTGMTFGDTERIKVLKGVVPRVDAPAGTVLTIQAGGSMDAETPAAYQSTATYTVGSTRKADVFATGRFLSLKISSSGAQPWRIKSYDVDVDMRGRF